MLENLINKIFDALTPAANAEKLTNLLKLATSYKERLHERVTCPECNSDKVRSYDNESLSHDEEWLKDSGGQYDTEVYIHFECHDCKQRFNQSFDLVPKA